MPDLYAPARILKFRKSGHGCFSWMSETCCDSGVFNRLARFWLSSFGRRTRFSAPPRRTSHHPRGLDRRWGEGPFAPGENVVGDRPSSKTDMIFYGEGLVPEVARGMASPVRHAAQRAHWKVRDQAGGFLGPDFREPGAGARRKVATPWFHLSLRRGLVLRTSQSQEASRGRLRMSKLARF